MMHIVFMKVISSKYLLRLVMKSNIFRIIYYSIHSDWNLSFIRHYFRLQ